MTDGAIRLKVKVLKMAARGPHVRIWFERRFSRNTYYGVNQINQDVEIKLSLNAW